MELLSMPSTDAPALLDASFQKHLTLFKHIHAQVISNVTWFLGGLSICCTTTVMFNWLILCQLLWLFDKMTIFRYASKCDSLRHVLWCFPWIIAATLGLNSHNMHVASTKYTETVARTTQININPKNVAGTDSFNKSSPTRFSGNSSVHLWITCRLHAREMHSCALIGPQLY